MSTITLTRDLIEQGKSSKGGFSAKQLALFGESYPLKRGWMNRMIGKVVSEDDLHRFIELKDAHLIRVHSGNNAEAREVRKKRKLWVSLDKVNKQPKNPKFSKPKAVPSYKEQYKHPNWQRRRLTILRRDKYRCRICNNEDEMLHVHHRTYKWGEYVWKTHPIDLITLCSRCHSLFHEAKSKEKDMLQVGDKLHRGDTHLGIVETREKDGKQEVRVMYLDKPELRIEEWYPASILERLWRK